MISSCHDFCCVAADSVALFIMTGRVFCAKGTCCRRKVQTELVSKAGNAAFRYQQLVNQPNGQSSCSARRKENTG